jgi:ribosomal protein L30/L7E
MEKKIIEEVIIRKKKQGLNKEKISEKIKNTLLQKKKKRDENHKYFSAQMLVKNYREKQKSFQNFKSKSNNLSKFLRLNYDKTKEHYPIILIRICGTWARIPEEIKNILSKLNLKNLFNAIILFYNEDNYKLIKLIENYITWGFIKKK